MTIEQRIQQGDFDGALALLAGELRAATPDAGQLLMAFNLEVRLQRFEAAQATMQRLLAQAPELAGPLGILARNARAEALATARLVDPRLAAQRSGIGPPPPHAMLYVKAAVHHAQRDHAGAFAALRDAQAKSPAMPGTMTWRNGRTARFADLADSDDLTGTTLPCYAGDSLLDVSYSQLRSISFLEPRTSFDVMWMPAELVPVTGSPAVVKVPSYYPGTGVASDPTTRTGQMTSWNHDRGYAQAIGQRDFKLITPQGGASMVGLLQVQRIEFG